MRRPLFYIIMFAVMTATAKGQTMQGNMKANGKVKAV